MQDTLFAWVSLPLALLNIMWKMEDSSENDNTLSQNDGFEMFLRESNVKMMSKTFKKTQIYKLYIYKLSKI